MRVVMASGKGGAGKTTVTACLALVWDSACVVVDADVEAPNLHLFLRPRLGGARPVGLEIPVLDRELCTACGACRDICRYKAIAMLGGGPVMFTDMCHGCGGCFEVCPAGALRQGSRELGVLEQGEAPRAGAGAVGFLMGRSRVGEAMSPPLLRALEAALARMLPPDAAGSEACPDVLLDAPPGVSCPAMTTARMADAVVLVAEPTPFGMYDFKLAHAAFAKLSLPLAVVMNKAGMEGNEAGDEELRRYCAERRLPLLAGLPFDRAAAESYARGVLPVLDSEIWRERFAALAGAVRRFAGGQSAGRARRA